MGLDDLFKHGGSHGHGYHHDDRHDGHDHGHDYSDRRSGRHHDMENVRGLLRNLPHKKALIITTAIVALLVMVVGVVFLWSLFPMVSKGFAYLKQDGVQGLLNQIAPLLQGIWKGTGAAP